MAVPPYVTNGDVVDETWGDQVAESLGRAVFGRDHAHDQQALMNGRLGENLRNGTRQAIDDGARHAGGPRQRKPGLRSFI